MTSQKDEKNSAAQETLIKKLKIVAVNLQRSLNIQTLQMKRQAQEIRELKTENAYLKEKVKRHG